MNIDLHIHSVFSDGLYSVEKIARTAIEKNLSVIGISDHFDTRKTRSILPEDIHRYLDEIERVQSLFPTEITLLKGIEIDTMDMVRKGHDITEYAWLENLDYILFEYIGNRPPFRIPLDYLLALKNLIPIPVGLAHTDISEAFPEFPFNELVDVLAQSSIFVELNESYNRPGEHFPFYRHLDTHADTLRLSRLHFTVGSDMHRSLEDLGAKIAMEFLDSSRLSDHIHPMITQYLENL